MMLEVIWRDAAMYEGEYELDPDARVGVLLRDVGQLVQVKDGFITLALERYEEQKGIYRHCVDIPLVNVLEIHELTRKRKLYDGEKPPKRRKKDAKKRLVGKAACDSRGADCVVRKEESELRE
ncbi:MAG TPA: hypothetical protein PLK67_00095 [Bryobacteraceae bacterium]|nr:hypothetical protein [Bryobacteraceae bacterium]HPO87334.1 hypothetical protein [Candidatus Hydrogenedentota bacterium]